MALVREQFLTAPPVVTAPSSILDHAAVLETDGFGWRQECALWTDYNGLDTVVPTALCPDALAEKVFETAPQVPGISFSVYGGVKCKLIGLDREEQGRELERVFRANEARGIELALMGTRFVDSDSDAACGWDGAEDLTPAGGAVSQRAGQAILEGWMGSRYAGVPTLHVPRTVASYLAHYWERQGDRFFTELGSKAINGAGYDPNTGPTGVAPSAGEYWIYATGEVVVERAALQHIDTVVMPGDGSENLYADGSADPEGIDHNTALALVERSFRVAVDGPVAAVRVEVY